MKPPRSYYVPGWPDQFFFSELDNWATVLVVHTQPLLTLLYFMTDKLFCFICIQTEQINVEYKARIRQCHAPLLRRGVERRVPTFILGVDRLGSSGDQLASDGSVGCEVKRDIRLA